MNRKIRVLIVDDDRGHRITLNTLLTSWGHETGMAEDGQKAVSSIKEASWDAVLMDVRMAEMDGISAMKEIKAYNPAIPILIMTAYSSVETAVSALKSGAYDYLMKPLDFDLLKLTLDRAVEHAGLKEENRKLKATMGDSPLDEIIGSSPAMKELGEMLMMIAPSEATVLITGESGTGKEMVARLIHRKSSRNHNPMVVVNCAALTDTLLESELFGHERGAFTGADRRREGLFMQADGGTLFLDEIGETSAAMQAKLLRVIQEREFQRVGGEAVISVDVRIIAATHRDLAEEVKEGRFREDLFYRLNVVSLAIPPLRKRHGDIPLLVQHFADTYAEKNRKTVKGITPEAMDRLVRHPWPGNVRELENTMERAVILMCGEFISERELPMTLTAGNHPSPHNDIPPSMAGRPLAELEKEAIVATLRETGGNKSETARRLGINRKTLHLKIKAYGLEKG
ncbi:sigma 54-interacting transcriptional regulator [Desulfoluna butyratoxydans]|uniref:Signal transduction response regulator receiver domain n=1 Tax=Desulfoluna butyratoxydans TaxID=231438 RepID=A0A4U8YH73_9BACT|nr:sigma 54-interacting transcriptional regulator [Desulfoluna butyratoxydans]VFQ42871.1 signal transduction response regulator receiver domain [Desulfoluna butyratoxydans]